MDPHSDMLLMQVHRESISHSFQPGQQLASVDHCALPAQQQQPHHRKDWPRYQAGFASGGHQVSWIAAASHTDCGAPVQRVWAPMHAVHCQRAAEDVWTGRTVPSSTRWTPAAFCQWLSSLLHAYCTLPVSC